MSSFVSIISRYGSFAPNYYSHKIQWDHWDLLHIHSGKLTIDTAQTKIIIVQGNSILIPPGTEFRIINHSEITTASVQYFVPVSNTLIENKLARFNRSFVFRAGENNQIEANILELMAIFNHRNQQSRKQELLLELIIEKILISRSGNDQGTSPWLKVINRYKSMLQNPPSIEQIAMWSGYSVSRFRAVFQQDTGLPPIRFFLNIKMENSAKMLTETILPIKEIAREHGYKEVSHFNRAFSKHFGLSPGRYRKKNAFVG